MKEEHASERFVCCLWAGQYLHRDQLRTLNDLKLGVTFPGHWNMESGPDFRGAKLRMGQGGPLLSGDVEVHLYALDWYRHGHHRDPAYNQVILQVVMFSPQGEVQIRREDGIEIPTLALRDFLIEELPRLKEMVDENLYPQSWWQSPGSCPSGVRTKGKEEIGYLLDQAGEQRLQVRVNRFRRWIENSTVDRILYEGIMESLGYARNRAQFLELSRRVDLGRLQEVIRSSPPEIGVRKTEALLFGTAGLLPPEGVEHLDEETQEYVAGLKSLWQEFKPRLKHKAMEATQWQFLGVRPANFPTRRIAAMAHFLSNCREQGLLERLIKPLTQTQGRRWLGLVEEMFEPKQTFSYWSFRYTFGGKRRKAPFRLVGRSRVTDILVNIIIPIALAYVEEENNLELKQLLWKAYNSQAKLSDNHITKLMTIRIFGEDKRKAKVINSASRQQGLIHLYQNFCEDDKRGCKDCILT